MIKDMIPPNYTQLGVLTQEIRAPPVLSPFTSGCKDCSGSN